MRGLVLALNAHLEVHHDSRLVVLVVVALAAMALPATALAGGDQAKKRHHLSGLDKRFLKEASAGNRFEVRLGELAQQKAANQSIKDVAAKISADHALAEQKVAALTDRYGVKIPGKPTATQESVLALLSGIADPAAFEAAWLKAQQAAHLDAIDLFTDELGRGHNRHVRGFAEASLPVLQMHLDMVQVLLNGTTPVPVVQPLTRDEGQDPGCVEGSSAKAA